MERTHLLLTLYLSQTTYTCVQSLSSFLIFSCAQRILVEAHRLRAIRKKPLVVIEGYAPHLPFLNFSVLRDSGIIVAVLLEHISIVLQLLVVGVYGTGKEELKNSKSRHTISTHRTKRNDGYKPFHLLCQIYHRCVTAASIVGGFKRSGILNMAFGSCDPSQIQNSDSILSTIDYSGTAILQITHTVGWKVNSSDASTSVHTF